MLYRLENVLCVFIISEIWELNCLLKGLCLKSDITRHREWVYRPKGRRGGGDEMGDSNGHINVYTMCKTGNLHHV